MATQPAPTGTAVATRSARDDSPVSLLERQIAARSKDIVAALPKHISFDKFQRTLLTAVAQNPDLLKADRQSLILSVYKAAQDGLLPDGREAALVVFKTNKKIDGQWHKLQLVQYMPMVYGLRKKVLQSGEITDIFASVVFRQEIEAGHFIYEEGTERMLRHKPILDPDFNPTDDDIALAYSVATFTDGSKSFEVMFRRDVNKVREKSQTGALFDKNGNPREPSGPWVEWFAEQAKKSVIRRHTKTLPMSSDVMADVEVRGLDPVQSAAWALSAEEDAPELITDETGDKIEVATGEVVGSESDDQPEDAGGTKAPEEKPARKRQAKAQEPNPPAPAADEDEIAEDAPSVAEELERHPSEAKAEEILDAFSKAQTIIDLEKAFTKYEADIEAMPDEINAAVCSGYNRERIRLGASRMPSSGK